MADSSTSSLTSTSHTLTVGPSMASGSVPTLGDIRSALAFRDALKKSERRSFLRPPTTLPTASTQFAQVALGEFAGQISDEQQERLRLRNAAAQALKKRKRNGLDPETAAAAAKAAGPVGPVLKIRKVHTEGFEIPQIWQQSNRILSASLSQLKHELKQFDEEDGGDEEDEDEAQTPQKNGVVADSDSEDVSDDEETSINGLDEDLEEDEFDEEEDEEDEDLEDMDGLDVDEDDEEEEEDAEEDEDLNQPEEDYIEDKEGLNDGFFDIDRFNKESQWFEDQDARADPKTDQVSDDEELDWAADPLAAPAKPKDQKKKKAAANKNLVKLRKRDIEYNNNEEEEDDEAPAFADMDLDAPSGESDNEMDGDGNLADGLDMDFTANDIYYKDFFAPPPRKREPGDRPGRPSRASAGQSTPFQPEEDDVERAMADVRRDLFDEVSEGDLSDEEDALSEVEAGDPKARRSNHERQQAKILAEIRKLEAEAVREKNWTLTGEASANARPVNSLLSEDLDFEYIGKPVPVITQEVNEDIESLVKRRVLAQEFDEVHRRYATGFGGGDDGKSRRGMTEIDDQQAKKGLAAVYEEEHLKNANPDTYISQSDERLQTEERAVEALWADISSKLDALSSWHYKPRPAEAGVTVVADVATVAMEDAQPATAQGVSGSQSMLAPQEIYKPGAKGDLGGAAVGAGGGEADKDVVTVAKSGLPVARDEMTREERKRRHRRNKERIRKSGSGLMPGRGSTNGTAAAGGAADGNGAISRGAQEKSATLAALQKAGVKVIGRKGEIRDLDGNLPKAARPVTSGNFKL